MAKHRKGWKDRLRGGAPSVADLQGRLAPDVTQPVTTVAGPVAELDDRQHHVPSGEVTR